MKTLYDALIHGAGGGKFEYISFDYKAAVAEFKCTKEFQDMAHIDTIFNTKSKIDKYNISPEIRTKYAIKRIGKLRKAEFMPDGTIRRLYIGNKYSITFYNTDDLKFV